MIVRVSNILNEVYFILELFVNVDKNCIVNDIIVKNFWLVLGIFVV